ncbi:hypothetical protein T440DRAFT_511817 [Plenodomus tracheiphilus IPT5]|uniref:DUF3533 domain-containing protein n=1 Tax=Plenodomus tracheiphilus IPT5 TaxID=1408161 RepID=A0A6A7ASB6_9PLEO|nr:hypothetical protein T440DRAFT_511817 [Plenodomus tracheiphilus IPT5]
MYDCSQPAREVKWPPHRIHDDQIRASGSLANFPCKTYYQQELPVASMSHHSQSSTGTVIIRRRPDFPHVEDTVREGNASYDPLDACQITFNSARDQTTASSYIVPSLAALQKGVIYDFGRAWIIQLLQNNISVTELSLDVASQASPPGVQFTVYDLRPFSPPIATADSRTSSASQSSYRYMWSTSHQKVTLDYTLPAHNIVLHRHRRITALWMISWIISYVATGFYALPLAPGFYRWGHVRPMHNVVKLTRSTLFDLHPRVGLNFGILFAGVALDSILFPLCCYYMRWNTARVKRNVAKAEADWHAKMDKEREDPSLLARATTRGYKEEDHRRRYATGTLNV